MAQKVGDECPPLVQLPHVRWAGGKWPLQGILLCQLAKSSGPQVGLDLDTGAASWPALRTAQASQAGLNKGTTSRNNQRQLCQSIREGLSEAAALEQNYR